MGLIFLYFFLSSGSWWSIVLIMNQFLNSELFWKYFTIISLNSLGLRDKTMNLWLWYAQKILDEQKIILFMNEQNEKERKLVSRFYWILSCSLWQYCWKTASLAVTTSTRMYDTNIPIQYFKTFNTLLVYIYITTELSILPDSLI